MPVKHGHYFRSVEHLERIDPYRIIDLYDIRCGAAQHVLKKSMAVGRRGHKDVRRDWQDILDTATRRLQMLDEDEAAGLTEDWPDESRRAPASVDEPEDVVIWPPEHSPRQQLIEQSGEMAEVIYPALGIALAKAPCGYCGAAPGSRHNTGCTGETCA